jgi:hypothetical protein
MKTDSRGKRTFYRKIFELVILFQDRWLLLLL